MQHRGNKPGRERADAILYLRDVGVVELGAHQAQHGQTDAHLNA